MVIVVWLEERQTLALPLPLTLRLSAQMGSSAEQWSWAGSLYVSMYTSLVYQCTWLTWWMLHCCRLVVSTAESPCCKGGPPSYHSHCISSCEPLPWPLLGKQPLHTLIIICRTSFYLGIDVLPTGYLGHSPELRKSLTAEVNLPWFGMRRVEEDTGGFSETTVCSVKGGVLEHFF